ncbi:MAG: phosphoglycerate kinase [Planctomycetota bacterium]|jgi:phosphoglycerate kinase|nr:phosphoglycerate kinase [Planctomycetota bacterium]
MAEPDFGLGAPGLASLDMAGRRVLVRVDFNVPLDSSGDGPPRITDDTRMRAALPTLRAILAAGGQPILFTHMGRPKGEVVEGLRLDPVALRLAQLLGSGVVKLDQSVGELAREGIAQAPQGSVVLLENVRFHPGETAGAGELAAAYAALGEVFINDAFGTSHRDHASVCGIARLLPAAAGLLLEKELKAFGRVLNEPARPLVAILGGAKVSDKLTVIDNLLERVDTLIVGGGMAYTFLAAQGHAVGTSLLEEERLESVRAALARAAELGVEIALPGDHVVAERFAADAPAEVVGIEIPAGRMGLDIGPRTAQRFAGLIAGAATVVWNGPMGVFEMEAFRAGTETVGRAVAACPGYTVVGGGDSVAALGLLQLTDAVDHVSTGGGASLELLEGKLLPGIAALGN